MFPVWPKFFLQPYPQRRWKRETTMLRWFSEFSEIAAMAEGPEKEAAVKAAKDARKFDRMATGQQVEQQHQQANERRVKKNEEADNK